MINEAALLSKTERILKNNVYPKDPKYPWYPYRMVCPDRGFFPGVWNWDSAFHAVGFLDIDEEIAKEQILGFTSFQREEDGIFPDLISYSDGLENTVSEQYPDHFIEFHYTKPPVMADAAWQVYDKTKDIDFLKTVYPRLVKNEAFWVNKRFKDGLFHYDAEDCDGEQMRRIWVGYESGMDNSPRWDDAHYDYFAIDLNCYMVTMYRALVNMAKVLGEDPDGFSEKERALTENINGRLWDGQRGIYCDYNYRRKTFADALTPVCFLPLYIGIAPKERAASCLEIARDQFFPGMPSVAYGHKSYSLDYWRGPCWLNIAYFAAKGLKNYGFDATADEIKETILKWVENDGDYVHENYDAKTGAGLCQKNFSWSCVFVRKFILDW